VSRCYMRQLRFKQDTLMVMVVQENLRFKQDTLSFMVLQETVEV